MSDLQQRMAELAAKAEQAAQQIKLQQTGPEPPFNRPAAIDAVKDWLAEEEAEELDPSERKTYESMVYDLREAADARGSDLTEAEIKQIVAQYAPNALHGEAHTVVVPPYPSALEPLVQSGIAFVHDTTWLVKRCMNCGKFANTCCGGLEHRPAVENNELTANGRQAVGIDPIKVPKPKKSTEQIQQEKIDNLPNQLWWSAFKSGDTLEGDKDVKMYISNFIPEGITLICGLPKEGKSYLALAIAKALTSGEPLFGRPEFKVPEAVPVLYLAAESGDRALKLRWSKMRITSDKTKFLCRTLGHGPMLGLDDPKIEQCVKALRPVIVLETLIRFNDGSDEDSATENRKLAENLFRLIAWGARCVIGIHHSRKDLDKRRPTKEAAVRGSGDALAMPDAVWLVMQDSALHKGGHGPNEIDVVGWGRDFTPAPVRLALTRKKQPGDTVPEFSPGIVSYIDTDGDLKWVNKVVFNPSASSGDISQVIERLVTQTPSTTVNDLIAKTNQPKWEIRKTLKQLGYRRGRGRHGTWVKS